MLKAMVIAVQIIWQTLKPSYQLGAGLAFKLSNALNIAIEERFTVTND